MNSRQPRGGMTYHERNAVLDTNDVKGRFAKEEASTVSMAHASAGPWADGPRPGLEPSIDGRDPAPIVGEPYELARAAAFAEAEQKRSGQNVEKIEALQEIVNRNPVLQRRI